MRLIALAALSLLATGCASESAPEGGITYAGEHPDVSAIIEQIQAAGIDCEADPAGPEETAYSAESQRCYTTPDESESLTVAVYASTGQLEEAKGYLAEMNPDTAYVWGDRWSVSAPDNATADRVNEALQG